MITCTKCNKDNNTQSKFCTHCGEALTQNVVEEPVLGSKIPYLGLALFFVGLIGGDFILAILFDAMMHQPVYAFYISGVIYGLAIAVSVFSLIQMKRNGNHQSTHKSRTVAYTTIVISLFVLVTNITQIINK